MEDFKEDMKSRKGRWGREGGSGWGGIGGIPEMCLAPRLLSQTAGESHDSLFVWLKGA